VSASDDPRPRVKPSVLIPRTLGWLNIVAGLLLLGFGMCCTAAVPFAAKFDDFLRDQQARIQTEFKQTSASEIDALKKQEAEAASAEDKAEIRAKIEEMQKEPGPPIIDFGTKNFGLKDPKVLAYFTVDATSGLILNLLLFISGFGLLRCREWGRKLSIGIAGLKLLRLIVLTTSLIFVVLPIMMNQVSSWLQESAIQITADAKVRGEESTLTPQEAAEVTSDLRVSLTALAIFILVVGAIYPVIIFVLLTRPSAMAACARNPAKGSSVGPGAPADVPR
jgi:hypothetical protein